MSLEKANRLLAKHKYEQAFRAYVAHAEKCPTDAAVAYARAGKCCQHFNVLKSQKKVSAEATLIFQSDRDAARTMFSKSLEHDPNLVEALIGLADALPRSSEKRLEMMLRALSIQPHYMTLINVGDFYRSVQRDLKRALEFYQQAVTNRPLDRTAYDRLEQLCHRLERPEEAKRWKANGKRQRRANRAMTNRSNIRWIANYL